MSKLFSFLYQPPYEERKVAFFKECDLIISTAYVSDGIRPFETAVSHPLYNENKFIVVEAYTTKEAAQAGHLHWVKTMTSSQLPSILSDCINSPIAQLCSLVGSSFIFKKGTI